MCFESSQSQRITSGLKRNFNLSPKFVFPRVIIPEVSFFLTTTRILCIISEHKTRKTITHYLESIYIPVLYRKQIRLLERFHIRCLRCILGLKWQDHVSNEEVLKRASLPNIEAILPPVQLRWADHVTRRRRTHAQSSLLQRAPRRKA